MSDSLFAHLALAFTSHPETLATAALGYVLNRSHAARAAIRSLLAQSGIEVSENVTWATEVSGPDSARPDLVALDAEGGQPIVIEAKFWAGLTDNQPLTYLERPGVRALVFVAPAARSAHLWGELRRRCASKGPVRELAPSADALIADIKGQKLVLVSWRALVAAMLARAESAGERQTAEDLSQLRGLCERMDTEAFLPVTSEELSSHAYRRVIEFGVMVDAVATKLVDLRVADITGLRNAHANGWYGRYLSLRGVGALLLCDVRKWMKYAGTPLWLSVYGTNWRQSSPQAVRQALAALEARHPPKMFIAGDGFPTVPLFVPVGVERDDVLKSVISQVLEVGELVAPLGAAGKVALPPPELPAETMESGA